MKKRLWAIACCLFLLVSLFAGCGSETEQTEETVTSQTEEAAETTEALPAQSAAAEESEDAQTESEAQTEESVPDEVSFAVQFPGADTAELSFSNTYSLPISKTNETITIMHEALNLVGPLSNIGIEGFSNMSYIQEVQERLGITLEIRELSHEALDQTIQLTIASGEMPDVICGLQYPTGDEGALADDVIVALDEYAEYAPNYFYMIESNPDQTNAFLSNGQVVAFKSPYDQYRANQGLVIRSDWLEELGLEVPETYDEMEQVLAAFKDAYGCESVIYMNTQCYITGLSDGYNVEKFAADGGAETQMPYYVDNGTVCSTLNADGYRDYLTMLHRWYEAGYLDPDFISIEYNPFSDYLSNQINDSQMGVWSTSGEGIDTYSVPVTCVPMLVQNEGDMDHIFTTSLVCDSQNDTYITTSCDNVPLVMQYLDYWYSVDGILFSNYGIEGETFVLDENNTPVFTDLVVNNEFGISVSNMMRLYCGYGIWSTAHDPDADGCL